MNNFPFGTHIVMYSANDGNILYNFGYNHKSSKVSILISIPRTG